MSSKDQQYLLWEEIAKGDPQALNLFIRKYSSQYYPFVYRWVGQQQQAEDILQEAFLKLWSRPHAFKPNKGHFQTWFYRVLYNLCMDFFRHKKGKVFVPYTDAENMILHESAPQEKSLSIDEKKQMLLHIAKLAPKEQAVLHLFYYEGFSAKETAHILKKSLRATESLLYRAKKNLAMIIEEKENA
ncbi:MAG: RNA polymerase sigma factor [Deltaproteobacteria bacterium]|nr:RNA polymerase sigma factor [Deltaproteobacteria bacterium]